MILRGQEPAQRWSLAREDFQPPHCLVAQSCPGNAAGGGLPSLAVRSIPFPYARVVTSKGVAEYMSAALLSACGGLPRLPQRNCSIPFGRTPHQCALSCIPSHAHHLYAWLWFAVPAPAVHADAWHGPQGSVYEGRGRKLTGTSAMRLRMSVLRQTGFLGPPEEGSKAQ